MHRRNYLFFIFLSISLMLLNCTYAQKSAHAAKDQMPSWVNNPHELYPEDEYIVGVGSGDTRQAAEDDAVGNIARVFKSKIKVDRTLIENYLEDEKSGDISGSTQTMQRSRVSTKMQLKNVKIDKSYFSPTDGVYYVLAYLDRRETAGLYRKDILQNQDKISEYYQHFKQEKNKLHKFAYINKAVALSDMNALLNEKFQILTKGGHVPAELERSTLVKERNDLLDKITVNFQPVGNPPQEILDYLHEVIGKVGFKTVQGAADFTIKYSFDLQKSNLQRKNIVAFNWKLTVDVLDNVNHFSLKTFNIAQRAAAISKGEARSRIMRNAKKALNKKFFRLFTQYLTTL